MLLCDIGNSNAKFYNNGQIYSMSINDFLNYKPNKEVFYINVNPYVKDKLKENKKFIDLSKYFELNSAYVGMGIDRVVACCGIKDGIVVDAGSAITIDVMQNSTHLGGFILPGISQIIDSYERISPVLKTNFNSNIELNCLPNKTCDAISFGIVTMVVSSIKAVAKDKKIFFTGGDGEFLVKYFDNAIYDKNLIFRTMLKTIKEKIYFNSEI